MPRRKSRRSPTPRVLDAGQRVQKRYNPKMYRIAIVALLVVLAGLQYRLWIGNGSWAQVHRLTQMKDQLHDANAQDETRNGAMQAEVDDLKSGDLATEGRARSEMGMIKRGERFFITVPGNPAPASLATNQQ